MSAIQTVDRPNSEPSNVAELAQLEAQRLDPFAIATFLRQHNTHAGMSVTVWRHGCLCILLEADEVPHPSETMNWLRNSLSQFKTLEKIRIYARQVGQNMPAWCDDLNLAQSAIAVPHSSSLLNWLHQGSHESKQPTTTTTPEVAAQQTRFLRFHLTAQETALLALESIREVLRVSVDNILPVPDTPHHVLGVYNHRGEIVWLVDLKQQLGFSELDRQLTSMLTVIVLQQDGLSLGAVVSRVTDIELHDPQNVQPTSADLFPLPLRSFLQGYLPHPYSFVLDARALITQVTLS
ncbi:chemotaxis protein CheW [Oscillatoria sp. FACHB-1407]|uniref:chemotaxis protein CheW n=1 Tax=Oscillatoria sp. FACHB-1407 TaxID=2692847 RepID=UPI001682F0DD|nr:chemotaxis protein CheW [Oscillatoria sp. FACHB-1407]MBD2461386.1 chemotaxis protein CheW [Oscillatoria sp. FACHB-1407]